MTTLQTYSEEETEEDTKFDIEINEFHLEYRYKGVDYCIFKDDLKDFYSIYLVGINSKKK